MLFTEAISAKVHERTAKKVHVKDVERSDGTVYTGLFLEADEGSNMSPVFNLSALTDKDKADLDALADRIIGFLKTAGTGNISLNLNHYESIEGDLRVRLMHKSNVPRDAVSRSIVADIVEVMYLNVSTPLGAGMALVNKDMAKCWPRNNELLFSVAEQNSAKDAFTAQPVHAIIGGPASPGGPNLICVRREDEMYGANVMVCDNIMDEVCGDRDAVVVLPSSVHEVLVLDYHEDSAKEDMAAYSTMVREINRNVLAHKDLLSDHVFVYHKGKGLVVAA